MPRRLKAFLNFQFFAFSCLIWGAEHVEGAMRSVLREGIRPTPCKEVLQAAWALKLAGKQDEANRLLEAVVR